MAESFGNSQGGKANAANRDERPAVVIYSPMFHGLSDLTFQLSGARHDVTVSRTATRASASNALLGM